MMVQELTSQDTHIGTKFRGVRTAKGLSYAQVAEAIKVRPEYLESIENLTQDGLPEVGYVCLLYTSPSPRDLSTSRMPSSA